MNDQNNEDCNSMESSEKYNLSESDIQSLARFLEILTTVHARVSKSEDDVTDKNTHGLM